MKSKTILFSGLLLLAGISAGCNSAMMQNSGGTQASGFQQINLVSDTNGTAARSDRGFINPWGIAFAPGEPFWIADNDFGTAKVVDPSGIPESPLAVGIPVPQGDASHATPTGIVFNPIPEDFQVLGTSAQFLFATEEGTISTWALSNGDIPTTAVLAVDNSGAGAVYKGLAIPTPDCCREYLALADFHNGLIATYDVQFNLLATIGSFSDPELPVGYAPLNIQQIGTQLFVTYALRDTAGREPVIGAGNGIVDTFDQEGTFQRRFASNGSLNAPWGMVQAPGNFGPFSNDILVGNFGDGTINAFDPSTGNFMGQLKDRNGKVISNPGLWALTFRNDGVADPNTLFFTAGASGQNHGLFGSIAFRN